jgi:hypothetical protein
MKRRDLEKMRLDDLWDLHQEIIGVLDAKLESEKQKLQSQLDELGRRFGGRICLNVGPTPKLNRSIVTRQTRQRLGPGEEGRRVGSSNC